MTDSYYYLERVTGKDNKLDLSTLFEDDNGNEIQLKIVNIIKHLTEKNIKINNSNQQILRFLFIK